MESLLESNNTHGLYKMASQLFYTTLYNKVGWGRLILEKTSLDLTTQDQSQC